MKITKTFSVMLFLALTVGLGPLASGCINSLPGGNTGDNLVTQKRQVPSFTGIRVGGAFEVTLTQGDTYSVVVEADGDIIDYITTEVSGDILKIGMKTDHPKFWHNNYTMRVTVTYKDLSSLDLSGAVEVETTNKLNGKDLQIESSGASEIKLDLAMQNLDMTASGASKLTLTGRVAQGKFDASGASELHCADLTVGDLALYGSGAVEAKVTVTGTLRANVSGACTVKYLGNPRVDVHSSGASTIKRAD
jgi:hypothetical protein